MIPFTIRRYQYLQEDDVMIQQLTGLKKREFEKLHSFFDNDWKNYFSKFTLEGVPRLRQASLRRNNIFADNRDALLFGLIYLKGEILQEELAAFFAIDQPKASKYLALIKRLLSDILKNPHSLPKPKRIKIIKALD
ncbi:hypothetical protein [Runella slithyformis]|uniref:Transposase Helix-turn-helix domain-containing protein n=1 Tax=Runella slithyformis (strain ATCC 29530 / DSM 19594 / LMG 11500 / NCIMB 11436 / LSU 4) TaxID=761193 RepID=A0A7U3ZHA0_RUNSL|nr:hypothetical protein [Runella slithyformis]AEI47202.1 hypothetical protein Runsl_0762 [Runella slithyformis DSM 19594]